MAGWLPLQQTLLTTPETRYLKHYMLICHLLIRRPRVLGELCFSFAPLVLHRVEYVSIC